MLADHLASTTHAGLLSMAAYNNDPTTVCAPTFDQAALQSSFPGSTEARTFHTRLSSPDPSLSHFSWRARMASCRRIVAPY